MKQVTAILLAGLFLLMGCQAKNAPLEAAQKNTDQIVVMAQGSSDTPVMTDAIDNAALRETYGVPERYTAELPGENGMLLVHADVPIAIPDTSVMPVIRVENGRFSQESVSRLFQVLCGNTTMYLYPEQEGATLIQSDGSLQTRPLPSEHKDAPSGTVMALNAISAVGEDNPTTFSVNNDATYDQANVYTYEDAQGNTQVLAPRSGSSFLYHRGGAARQMDYHNAGYYVCDVSDMSFTGAVPSESILTVSPQQARSIAQTFLSDAQISDMVIDSMMLYSSKQQYPKGALVPDETPTPDGSPSRTDTAPEQQCYSIRCIRKVNGVRVESTEAYSEYNGIDWWYEALWITVDNQGISNVYWTAPLQQTSVETENAKLISWQQVREIFEKMFMVSYGFLVRDTKSTVEFSLSRVELCLQRINEEGSFTNGLLVPVWNFYGWYTDNTELPGDEMLFPLISINAIDGSVIDVNQGF